MEQWKDVVGYEGLYQVSDLGRVKRNGRIKTLFLSGDGRYFRTQMSKNDIKRNVYVHRIVAAAWIGPCPVGCEVRHGRAGKHDNSVGNLSYGTPSQNGLDKRRDGGSNAKRVIRSDGAWYASVNEAAEEVGCWATAIARCCRGVGKSAGGYGWSYL